MSIKNRAYKAYIDNYHTYYFVVCTTCTVEELPVEYKYRVSVRNWGAGMMVVNFPLF